MTAEGRAGGCDFATLLRQRRRAAGLTQAELARVAGLSVRTVREAERGRTNRPQRTTAVLLADGLGLTGEERVGFLGAARGDGPPTTVAAPRAAGRAPLPPRPLLIGREQEREQLTELLLKSAGGGGPVALVGMAGVGKSVLALALAHQLADHFPGGVAAVTVGGGAPASQVLASVTAALGVARPGQLIERLAGQPALLLLDGVDGRSGQLSGVLAKLPPTVRVLTTGRAPLGLAGEQVWPVGPLAVPSGRGELELADVAAGPAAALFLRRLAAVRPEPLAADEVPALVGLVRRLGGLPLALEFAAGHGRLLRLPEILQRYGHRVLDLGEGEDTLRAAVAGSYQLLRPAEQAGLRRLAVFRGGWSVALAEQLLGTDGPGGDPVPLLDRLVSLGLVEVTGGRENGFRMLAVVRDFGIEQAAQLGELTSARRAHAVVVARFAGRVAPAMAGPGLVAAAQQLDDLAGEVWSALNHAANDDPPTALALAAWLPRWWRLRGRDRAGRQWLRRVLADPRTAHADPAVRAWAMVGLARLAHEHGEGAAERSAAESALVEFRRLGLVAGELAAAQVVAAVCLASGEYEAAREHCRAALAVATRHGRPRDAAIAQVALAWHEVRSGDLPEARRRLAAVDRLGAQSGDRRLRLLATAGFAELARLRGRPEEAVATARRSLGGLLELGDPRHRRRVLGTLGQALAALGRTAEAQQVLARLRAEDGLTPGPPRPEPRLAGDSPVAGFCAAIEARLALGRGEREVAAEWFTAAAAASRRGEQGRERVEALVELAACVPDPQRRVAVRAELARCCRVGGFVLLARERALLGDNCPE